jgi:hypothetical protein
LTLSNRARVGFSVWIILVILFVLCGQLPLYFLATTNFRARQLEMVTLIVYIWTAVLTVVLVLNLFAFYMVTKLQKNRKGPSSDPSSEQMSIDEILVRIKQSAVAISVTMFILIFFLNYMIPMFRRSPVADPRCDLTTDWISLRMGITFWLIAFGIPLWCVSPFTSQKHHPTRVVSDKISTLLTS